MYGFRVKMYENLKLHLVSVLEKSINRPKSHKI